MNRRGVRWGYLGLAIGGVTSIAANIAHALLPAHPPAGSVVAAAFWPVALFVTIEILAKNAWPVGLRWTALRWGGTVPVAVVTAVVSYRHMSGLLTAWGEDPLTATIGPIAVDGLLVMSSGAVIAAGMAHVARAAEQTLAPVSLPISDTEPAGVAVIPEIPATGVGIQASDSKSAAGDFESPAGGQPRPGKPVTVPDAELATIIRRVQLADPRAGYGKVTAAIEDAGWAVGRTDRIKAAIATHKRNGIHVVPTSAAL